TGSPSNVHPSRYGVAATPAAEPYDEARDGMTFALMRRAIERGVPLFAICRGFQELNVAWGGTLHARLHEQPGRVDHRMPRSDDADVRYGPAHALHVTAGGLLYGWLGSVQIEVNSLHGQGVDRLGDGLEVEGRAPDGTIEAFSVADSPGFVFAVQWHPEYRALDNAVSRVLFGRFGEAVAARAAAR
ncbi:MAG: gamma-glutamyl-gamma-aminobutyrate hydrolase family protein, partial [Planctomycetes bacterium]|nr:gamma-glutamyl-gamma-aminobutyrate hydrolase family protein [Planctomycetota bacterium]